jgi:hypothetical protein
MSLRHLKYKHSCEDRRKTRFNAEPLDPPADEVPVRNQPATRLDYPLESHFRTRSNDPRQVLAQFDSLHSSSHGAIVRMASAIPSAARIML